MPDSGRLRTRDRIFPWLSMRQRQKSPRPPSGTTAIQAPGLDSSHKTTSGGPSSPRSQPPAFWTLAYEKLKKDSPKLLEDYEGIISENLLTASSPDFDHAQVASLLVKKLQEIDDSQWRFKLGECTIVVRAQVKRLVGAVVFAKSFIASAVSSEPHAALAWAGISILLPLLLNPVSQEQALLDGLDAIAPILCRFTAIERVYLQYIKTSLHIHTSELQLRFEKMAISLLASIIDFQARATCHLSRSFVGRTTRDIVLRNDWTSLICDIRACEEGCDRIMETINSASYHASVAEVMLQLQNIQDGYALLRDITNDTLAEVKSHRQEERLRSHAEVESKIMQELYTTPYENQRQIPSMVPGTCKWFIEHGHYISWKQRHGPDVLWVSADPGCGKSTLCKYLVEEELCTTASRTTCYFFFKNDSSGRTSATNALAAIIHQLLASNPTALTFLSSDPATKKDLAVRGKRITGSFETLWNILLRLSKVPGIGSIVCILDALDECESRDRHLLVNHITEWYKGHVQQIDDVSTLKFIATSRPYADIDRGFQELTGILPEIQLKAEWESDKIEDEILLVIEQRLLDIQRELRIKNSVKEAIALKLQSIENKTYLWLSLVLDQIQSSLKKREQDLLAILDHIPDTLSKAYASNLSNSPEPETARQILQLVMCARRPLTVMETSLALALYHVDDYIKRVPEDELEFVTEDTIRQICGFLITIDRDSNVQFIHQTVREFLVATPFLLDPKLITLSVQEAHLCLAKCCLRTLMLERWVEEKESGSHSMTVPDSDSSTDDDPVLTRNTSDYDISHVWRTGTYFTWYDYAQDQWDHHVRGAEDAVDNTANDLAIQICWHSSRKQQRWCHLRQFSATIDPLECTTLGLLVYHGVTSTVRRLLENHDVDVNEIDFGGQTALSVLSASPTGMVAMVDLLLAHGASLLIENKFGHTPVATAALSGNHSVLEHFLKHGAMLTPDPALPNSELQLSSQATCGILCWEYAARYPADLSLSQARVVLLKAIQNDCSDIVASLLHRGVVDNWPASSLYEPLRIALQSSASEELVLEIIKFGPVISAERGSHGDSAGYNTCLSRIIEKWKEMDDEFAIMRALLSKNINVNLLDLYGHTPLTAAVKSGHQRLARLLIQEAGADINVPDQKSRTALIWASISGVQDLVTDLIAHGASVNVTDDFGSSALHQAAYHGHTNIVALLINAGAKTDLSDQDGATALHLGISNDRQGLVETLIVAGADINAVDQGGLSPLHIAVSCNNVEAAHVLLSAGAGVETASITGDTPLHIAAAGHLDDVKVHPCLAYDIKIRRPRKMIVDTLLASGARVSARSKDGRTPLHWAVDGIWSNSQGPELLEALQVVAALVAAAAGSEVDVPDSIGETPLMCAARSRPEMLAALFDLGVVMDIRAMDKLGRTALSYACECGGLASVDTLLKHGAEVGTADLRGRTPLSYAVCSTQHSKSAIQKLARLLAQGADVNGRDLQGRSILSHACQYGHPDVLRYLLDQEVQLDDRDEDGHSPLYWACRSTFVEVKDILLDHLPKESRDKSEVEVAAQMGAASEEANKERKVRWLEYAIAYDP